MLRLSLTPERENEQPRRGQTNCGRWIAALLEGLPPDVPPAARDRLADALIPLFGSDAVVWTTDIAQLLRDQAIELLVWMAQALIAACGVPKVCCSRELRRYAEVSPWAEVPL